MNQAILWHYPFLKARVIYEPYHILTSFKICYWTDHSNIVTTGLIVLLSENFSIYSFDIRKTKKSKVFKLIPFHKEILVTAFSLLERFSIENRKTKTKLIVTANQIRAREILLRVNENKARQTNCLKCGKAQVTKTPLLLVLHLIGREELQVL